MKIIPLSQHIGALIDGIELASLSEQEFDAVYAAYLKHKVLFFRDQNLTPSQHLALGRRFGELEPVHPFFPHLPEHDQVVIIETIRGNPPSTSYWHTDLTWKAVPSRCSLLHAQHCPPEGGDTIWVSMEAVFRSLSNEEQRALMELTTTHALHAFSGSRYDRIDEQGRSSVVEKSKAFPPVVHPMISKHPETGQPSLYINEQFTRSVNGMDSEAGRALLDKLFKIARKEEFQVRFSWQPNSLAIWDNACTQHFAVTDYSDQPRRLHRVTVVGEPVKRYNALT